MATGGDHERVRVTLLIGEANWASWKVQMWHQLQSKKLWKLVKGEETLAEGAEQPKIDAFEARSIDATMRLTHAMSPTIVLLVQALDCPIKIWNRLKRQYEKRMAASKLSLVQKYFGAKMAEGESAKRHLLNMSELCDRLAAVELPVPEEFQPLMILASLPASSTAIVQTLGSQTGKLELSHVTSTIMDEDSRRRGSGRHDDQALVSHGGQPCRNPAKRVQCYKLGHSSRDCPEPPKHHNQSAALTHRGGSRPKSNRKSTSYRLCG